MLPYILLGISVGFALMVMLIHTPFTDLLFSFLASGFALLTVALIKYDYFIDGILNNLKSGMPLNEIEIKVPNYEISSDGEFIIVKKGDNTYFATGILRVLIYKSSLENSHEANLLLNDNFERAFSNIRKTIKMTFMLYLKDLSLYKNQIERKREKAVHLYEKIKNDKTARVYEIERYQRMISMWDNQLKLLMKKPYPMSMQHIISITREGTTIDSAILNARNALNEAKLSFENSLNCNVIPLKGEELERFIEPDMYLPLTSDDLRGE